MAKYTAVHPMLFGKGRSYLDIVRYIQTGRKRKVGGQGRGGAAVE